MSHDLNFQKLLDKLQEIHDEFSDLKFGYIVQSALDKGKIGSNKDLHDYSSKHLLLALNEFHRHIKYQKGRKGKNFRTVKGELLQKVRSVEGISAKQAQKIVKDMDSEETMLNLLYPENFEIDHQTREKLRKVFKHD